MGKFPRRATIVLVAIKVFSVTRPTWQPGLGTSFKPS